MSFDTLQIRQAAAAVAGAQQYPAPALYMVATPIGNVADLSLRALHVLGLVDAVACEDSRVTGYLLHRFGIDKPLLPLHQHNEHEGAATVLGRLRDGQRIAYTSDAGTPALSDPGALLVRDVAAQGFRIVPVPGASSIASALSVAGDAAAQGFRFCGFAPAKGAARLRALTDACTDSAAQVWLEAPHRVAELAEVWSASANLRQVTVCRELTKQFETVVTLSAGDLPQWLAADVQRLRGEFVLVLHAAPAHDAAGAGDDGAGASDVQTLRTLDILLGELPLKQAVSLAARISGASRNTLYAQALQRKAE